MISIWRSLFVITCKSGSMTLWPYDQTCSVLSGRWLQQNLLRTCRKITPWRSSSQSWAVKKQFFCWKKTERDWNSLKTPTSCVWPSPSHLVLHALHARPGVRETPPGPAASAVSMVGGSFNGGVSSYAWLPEGFEPASVLKLLLSPFRASVFCGCALFSTPSHRCRA